MTPVLAWSVIEALAGAAAGAVAGGVVGWLASRRAPEPAGNRRTQVVAALSSETGRLLAGLAPADPRARLDRAWNDTVRSRLVDHLVEGKYRFTPVPSTARDLRRAAAALLRDLGRHPESLRALVDAARPAARCVPLRALLPADEEARVTLLRSTYEALLKPHVVATLATLDVRKHLRPAELAAVMDDDLLRRTTALILRTFARDRDRLRKLHAALGDAYGGETLLSVGPFQLTVQDLLRKVITVAEAQNRLTQGANLLDKPLAPKARVLRDAALDASLGWPDAWMQLDPAQRRRAVTTLHDKVFPIAFPIVAEALWVALEPLTLADVLGALPIESLQSEASTLAAALDASEGLDDTLPGLAPALLDAWRAIPVETRRPLVASAVDALAPQVLDAVGGWLETSPHTFAPSPEAVADVLASIGPSGGEVAAGHRVIHIATIAGGVAGLVASLV